MPAASPSEKPAAPWIVRRKGLLYALLPPAEAPRGEVPANLIRGRPVTDERTAAYGILSCLLAEYGRAMTGLAVDRSGRPYLPDSPDVHVSLSYTRGCAAAAVSSGPAVGIDVEALAAFDATTAELALTAAQREQVKDSTDPDRAFTRLWVRKEAAGKALGAGIDGDVLAAPTEKSIIRLRGVAIRIEDIAAPTGILAALARIEGMPEATPSGRATGP